MKLFIGEFLFNVDEIAAIRFSEITERESVVVWLKNGKQILVDDPVAANGLRVWANNGMADDLGH